MDFTAHVVGFDIEKNPKAKAEAVPGQQHWRPLPGCQGRRRAEQGAARRWPRPPHLPRHPLRRPACGNFVEGPEFAMNRSTWPTGEHASLSAEPKPFDPIEMGKDADARMCQKLCTDDKTCTAGSLRPLAAISAPCPCATAGTAWLHSVRRTRHPGNAMGVKKGVRQIVREAGAACK